ncbi:FAD-binding protein [Conyzicola nivalis]|uniref:Xylitol oxidase n=1 Tax=Conyzicola nivalis TaxID=1477021 RepID=A0A916SIU3_9MICO|nr:FAD-binding protein [Conyzicola nivalis]GGA98440.1 xylitol oxidase [Conyzicola nivalis]
MSTNVGENWARSYEYTAETLARPTTVGEVQDVVAAATRVRALGSRHSFTDLADSPGTLVSLDLLDAPIEIDPHTRTVTVGGGVRYGDLATRLQGAGWALHNLASLPHISVAGAVATGTHGSGDANGTLSAAVSALEIVTASGELLTLRRGQPDFDGAVVSLGALGIVTRVSLDIQPTFDVRQDLYDDLAFSDLLANFDAVTSSAYSVSLFTDWLGDTLATVWIKSRMDAAAPPERILGAERQVAGRHMLPDQPASNVTQQGGIAGPWSDRLAHFKLGFTPSNGDELQSEYLVPRRNAVAAIEAVRALGPRIAPLLLVTELRTMAADSLWLSGAHETDAVGIHFTWKPLAAEVRALLPKIEAALLPLGARPHWGKVFVAERSELEPLFPRIADFRELAGRLDPQRKFGNAFLERTVY